MRNLARRMRLSPQQLHRLVVSARSGNLLSLGKLRDRMRESGVEAIFVNGVPWRISAVQLRYELGIQDHLILLASVYKELCDNGLEKEGRPILLEAYELLLKRPEYEPIFATFVPAYLSFLEEDGEE